jgi:hypothetical protein
MVTHNLDNKSNNTTMTLRNTRQTYQQQQSPQLRIEDDHAKYTYALRETTFWSTLRATPVIWNVYNIINVLSEPSPHHLYITGMYLTTFYSNDLFKTIARKLYSWYGSDNIPLLGRGSRPDGAENAGYFLKLDRPQSITFGMPSGHAQKAAFMSTYLCINLLNSSNYSITSKILCSCGLSILTGYIGISRTYVERCHTTNQIIAGYVIGSMMGMLAYEFEKDIIYGMTNSISFVLGSYICPTLSILFPSYTH